MNMIINPYKFSAAPRTINGLAIYDMDFTVPPPYKGGTMAGFTKDYGDPTDIFKGGIGKFTGGYVENADGSVTATLANRMRRSDLGYFQENDRLDVVLWNRDATNAAWVKTNMTAAKTSIGLDKVANAASRITATANNATILQTIVLASSTRYCYAWLKREVGSGPVRMTTDGGTTWTDVTAQLTSSYQRVSIPAQTVVDPVVGFQIGTSGDSISFDFVCNNAVGIRTPQLTTTAAARAWNDRATADDTVPGTGNNAYQSPLPSLLRGGHGFYMELSSGRSGAQVGPLVSSGGSQCRVTASGALTYMGPSGPTASTPSGQFEFGRYAFNKIAGYIKSDGTIAVCCNGNAPVQISGGILSPGLTHMDLATNGSGVQSIEGIIRRVAFFGDGVLTNEDLVNFTSQNQATINAVDLFGPGHGTGGGLITSTGSPVNYVVPLTNRSGKAITVGSLVFSGWGITSSGTQPVGNDVSLTANIEYPIGGTSVPVTLNGNTTITAVNNTNTVTDKILLTTPIPPGATFNVNLNGTVANGLKYFTNFGLSGVRSTSVNSGLVKEVLFAVGDSIMTNNGGALTNVAKQAGCPIIQMSIGGTTAKTYGQNNAQNFQKQVELAVLLGVTRFVSNFGTNDFNDGLTDAPTLISYLNNLAALANSNGIKWTQCTMLPRNSAITITASSVTSVGNELYATVPNASIFTVGKFYRFYGANEADYLGTRTVKSVDTSSNIVTFHTAGHATPTATGTITITAWRNYSLAAWQDPNVLSGVFVGSGSKRGLVNAYIRGGAFNGGYIDWSDNCELVRDSNIWKVGGDDPALLAPVTGTITTGFTTATRFQVTPAPFPQSAGTSGEMQFLSGTNFGYSRGINGNNGQDITATSAFPNVPAIGDQLILSSGSANPTDDGIHLRVSTGGVPGYGGQRLIEDPTRVWLSSLLVSH